MQTARLMVGLLILSFFFQDTVLAGQKSGNVPFDSLNAKEKEAFRWAESAGKDLGKDLRQRLEKAIAEKGLDSAIPVCHLEAPKITDDVARKWKVKIGRTSHRLRNRKNAPPAWVKDLLADKPRIYRIKENKLAFTFPIRTVGLCIMCHGPEETIAKDVKANLGRLYPQDKAVGFREGNLRGQFWVELSPD